MWFKKKQQTNLNIQKIRSKLQNQSMYCLTTILNTEYNDSLAYNFR